MSAQQDIESRGYRFGLRRLDAPMIPFYVRTYAKHHRSAYVVIGGGGYQLLTAEDAAEFVRNSEDLAC